MYVCVFNKTYMKGKTLDSNRAQSVYVSNRRTGMIGSLTLSHAVDVKKHSDSQTIDHSIKSTVTILA